MLKAVIFDMDGVIIDSEPLHRKAYHSMFKDVGIKVPENLYESFTGQSTTNICSKLCSHFKLSQSPEDLVSLKRHYYKQVFDNDMDLTLIDGVLELIKNYHNNGLTLLLASSAAMTSINQVFERFDLNRYFKAKLSGADLEQSKPHPAIFEMAVAKSGFYGNECMVIEDSTSGIKAAKAANIFCVGYNSFHSKNQDYSKSDLIITDFRDIYFDNIIKRFS